MVLNDVLRLVPARIPVGVPSVEFEGACIDSRAVTPGSLFVGLRGESQDGGTFAYDALRAGAVAAVVSESAYRWVEPDLLVLRKPVIVAEDPLGVLQTAGRLALERLGARVVAVTGATGKTTTKDILVAMLRAAGVDAAGTPGNMNTDIGVPMALLGLAEGTQVAVVEMGMRGMGQIAELARLAPPDVACITAIGPVHLELVGSVEAVAAAKAEALEALRPGGVAVVPRDEPLLDTHVAALPEGVRVLRFGDRPEVDLDLPGLAKGWQLRNAAAAYACCAALGMAPPAGTRVEVELSAMRGQERPLASGGILIEDCYNANPVAMAAALRDLVARPGRRVAVLGDMRELGPQEAGFHREVGGLAASLGVDLLVAVGDLARHYVEGAGGAVESVWFPTVEEAVAGAGALLGPQDVVLVKGSRGMALERVGAAIAPVGSGV
ncbi:MAG: UDP-N-acetylmuramoyl-tripeptide--D-alanyl-D-alanine ligase [Actinomycetota bacterium]